jgi:hypothetical protein
MAKANKGRIYFSGPRKSDILIRRVEDTKGAIRIINVHDPYDPCGYDNKRVRVKVRVRVMVKARVKVSARVRVRLKARIRVRVR